MGDNKLLIALTMIERIEPQLKIGKRDQISRVSLDAINRSVKQALDYIGQTNLQMTYVLAYLLDASNMMDTLLAEGDSFIETTVEVKEMISDKIMSCLDLLYLEVGKYYTTHDFNYSIKLEPVLIRVINMCLKKGYYFGEE